MGIVIKVENLGKKYIISHQQVRYTALRDVVADTAKNAVKKVIRKSESLPKKEEFWALRNIDFEVSAGDRIGIIGRNGAGKSTLLKLLSRITEPSEGKIKIKGKISTLLEVGTGFHTELTGRENIFLNGAILGMSKKEIQKKFDEIVEFSEVEKFLDTPVKRYSSGMYVRLAFSVAAHLDTDILIVDEVLAVGDTEFQKKCLNKMDSISTQEGKTVLFVSHNLSAIEHLCNRGFLINSGKLIADDEINIVIGSYLKNIKKSNELTNIIERKDRTGNGKIKVSSFRALNINFEEAFILKSGNDYYFEIGYINNTNSQMNNIVVSLDIYDDKNSRILLFRTNFSNDNLNLNEKEGKILCKVENLPLVNGIYSFSIFISYADAEILDYIEHAAFINVEGGDSLTHMLIVTEIEKSFNIRFKLKELNKLQNIGSLAELVQIKLQ